MKGTLFVDELPFEITDIRLEDARVWFFCRRQGPVPNPGVSQWRVHAPDGSLIVIATVDSDWPRRPATDDGYTWIELPVSIVGAEPGEEWPKQMTERKRSWKGRL